MPDRRCHAGSPHRWPNWESRGRKPGMLVASALDLRDTRSRGAPSPWCLPKTLADQHRGTRPSVPQYAELCIAVGTRAACQNLVNLMQPQSVLLQPVAYDRRTNRRSQRGHPSSDLTGRQVGHTTSSSSGSPAMRTSNTAIRLVSSSGSVSTFFFDRLPAGGCGQRPDHVARRPIRAVPVRWFVASTRALQPHTRYHHVRAAELRQRHSVVDPSRTTSHRNSERRWRLQVNSGLEKQTASLASLLEINDIMNPSWMIL